MGCLCVQLLFVAVPQPADGDVLLWAAPVRGGAHAGQVLPGRRARVPPRPHVLPLHRCHCHQPGRRSQGAPPSLCFCPVSFCVILPREPIAPAPMRLSQHLRSLAFFTPGSWWQHSVHISGNSTMSFVRDWPAMASYLSQSLS